MTDKTVEEIGAAIERDAKEFGLCVKQGGWRMGLLVARNVDASSTGGRPSKTSEVSEVTKVSCAEFCRLGGGISDKTVKKYLDAWNRAADKGLVQPSSLLSPDEDPDYLDVDKLPSWDAIYNQRKSKATTKTETDDDTVSAQPFLGSVQSLVEMMFDLHNDFEAAIVKAVTTEDDREVAIEKLEMTHRALGTYIETLRKI